MSSPVRDAKEKLEEQLRSHDPEHRSKRKEEASEIEKKEAQMSFKKDSAALARHKDS